MLLTEGEARQKWCPFATTSAATINELDGIFDTRGESHGFTACIASDCMAWDEYSESHDFDDTEGDPVGYCQLIGLPREVQE